jgi:hypothetical protein
VYIFYHPRHICDAAGRARSSLVEGVNIANGHFVRYHAVRGERNLTYFDRQLGSLRDLFCDSAKNDDYIPAPSDARDYLLTKNRIQFSRAAIFHTMDIPPPPEVGTMIPDEILGIIHGEDKAEMRPSDRWKVVFVSDPSPD